MTTPTPCCRCGKPITLADLPFHGAGLCDQQARFTPLFTPWRVESDNGMYSVWTAHDERLGNRNNFEIAGNIQTEEEANLFAASPELLKELERLVALISNSDVTIPRKGIDLAQYLQPAKDLISKASNR